MREDTSGAMHNAQHGSSGHGSDAHSGSVCCCLSVCGDRRLAQRHHLCVHGAGATFTQPHLRWLRPISWLLIEIRFGDSSFFKRFASLVFVLVRSPSCVLYSPRIQTNGSANHTRGFFNLGICILLKRTQKWMSNKPIANCFLIRQQP
jgi:hypothetical protein